MTDLGNIGLRVGTVIGPPASEFFEHEFDANSDGAITVTDLANVGLRVGTVLPGGDPVPPGLVSSPRLPAMMSTWLPPL